MTKFRKTFVLSVLVMILAVVAAAPYVWWRVTPAIMDEETKAYLNGFLISALSTQLSPDAPVEAAVSRKVYASDAEVIGVEVQNLSDDQKLQYSRDVRIQIELNGFWYGVTDPKVTEGNWLLAPGERDVFVYPLRERIYRNFISYDEEYPAITQVHYRVVVYCFDRGGANLGRWVCAAEFYVKDRFVPAVYKGVFIEAAAVLCLAAVYALIFWVHGLPYRRVKVTRRGLAVVAGAAAIAVAVGVAAGTVYWYSQSAVVVTDAETAAELKEKLPFEDWRVASQVRVDAEKDIRDVVVYTERRVYPRDTEYVTVIAQSHTGKHGGYGNHSWIQIELDGEWYAIGFSGVNSMGFPLPPGEAAAVKLPMRTLSEQGGFEWPAGHYRVVKDLWAGEADWFATAEFYLR